MCFTVKQAAVGSSSGEPVALPAVHIDRCERQSLYEKFLEHLEGFGKVAREERLRMQEAALQVGLNTTGIHRRGSLSAANDLQDLRGPSQPKTRGIRLENLPNHRRLVLVDSSYDVEALPPPVWRCLWRKDLQIVVAVRPASRDRESIL